MLQSVVIEISPESDSVAAMCPLSAIDRDIHSTNAT